AHDVDMAALSLSALSFGLPAFALVKVVAPAFYARQDTRTPVRAAVVAMIANMALNLLFVAVLFALWHRPEDLADGWLGAPARVPGLHMALALASALASYLNLVQLWTALRRDGVYVRQPGWGAHLLRLGLACAAMVAVIGAGLARWPDWSAWTPATRALRLTILIGAAGAAFVVALFAAGFRLRDLRAH
ncbi:MAG TPA: lipid II flippase MurJ, partial [Dokdonella sp.]